MENKETKFIAANGVYKRKVYKWSILLYQSIVAYLKNINLDDIDIYELRDVFNICGDLVLSGSLDYIWNSQSSGSLYVDLYNLLIDTLNKKVNGIPLGDIMIKMSIQEGVFFTIPELAYDLSKEYRKLGMGNIPRFDYLKNNGGNPGSTDLNTLDIQLNVISKEEFARVNYTKDGLRGLDLLYLETIRHEIGHVIQFTDESEMKFSLLFALLRELINQRLYNHFHDDLPLEYLADIRAYVQTATDLRNDYGTPFSEELIFELKENILERNQEYSGEPLKKMTMKLEELVKKGEISDDRRNIVMERIDEVNNAFGTDMVWKSDDSYIRRLIK